MRQKYSILCFLIMAIIFASCAHRPPAERDYEDVSYNPSAAELERTGIPVIKIVTDDGQEIESKSEWKAALIEVIGNHCGFENVSIETMKIKGRGNTTWGLPKRPYSIKLDSKSEILGMKKSKRWVLIANYSDKSLLRNDYASYLGNNLYNACWNPSFKSVHLILNDTYRGVYLFGEQIKIDKNRVNIKSIGKSKDDEGGFIFEINERLDEKFNFKTKKGVCISLKDPDDVDSEVQQKVQAMIQTAEDVLFGKHPEDPENGWRKYFDEKSVIDWYLTNEITKNIDAAYWGSIYFYFEPKDGLFHMGPSWDFDISCGNVYYDGGDKYTGLFVKEKSVWVRRLFSDPEFVAKLKQRWNSTKQELYDSINTWIPEQAALLEASAEHNFKKWQILGNYVWPNEFGFSERKTYQSEVDYLINWLNLRYEYLDKAINRLK